VWPSGHAVISVGTNPDTHQDAAAESDADAYSDPRTDGDTYSDSSTDRDLHAEAAHAHANATSSHEHTYTTRHPNSYPLTLSIAGRVKVGVSLAGE